MLTRRLLPWAIMQGINMHVNSLFQSFCFFVKSGNKSKLGFQWGNTVVGTCWNQGGPDACTSTALLGSGWIKPSCKQHDGQLRLEIPVYQSLFAEIFLFFQAETQEALQWGWFTAPAWPGGQSTHDGRERKWICDNLLYSQLSHHAPSEWKRRLRVAVCQDLTLASDDEMRR